MAMAGNTAVRFIQQGHVLESRCKPDTVNEKLSHPRVKVETETELWGG